MPDDTSPVASMQAAYERAHEAARETLLRSRTEVVDRPWDGRRLTAEERRNWTKQVLDTPALAAAKQAEMRQKYGLTDEKPVSRRLVQRITQGIAELKRAEKENS
jgi:hypothetical protein